MLIKATLLGMFAASAPLYLFASQNPEPQGPGRDAEPDAVQASAPAGAVFSELDLLRQRQTAELEELRAQLADALQRADAAGARADDLAAQLDECMGFLLEPRPRSHGCRPSRPVSKHYQWMRQHGHDARAQQALAQYIEEVGDDNDHLNRAAWTLMTDEQSAGQYDELALGLCNRMQERGGLDHRQLDTVALAKFLNGHVDEAIALQKQAIEQGGQHDDDYRRRLRTYEAAKRKAAADQPARKISDD